MIVPNNVQDELKELRKYFENRYCGIKNAHTVYFEYGYSGNPLVGIIRVLRQNETARHTI